MSLRHFQAQLYGESHSRPSPLVAAPAQVLHFACVEQGDGSEAIAHLEALCDFYGLPLSSAVAQCFYRQLGGFELRYERHQEFTTYTLIKPLMSQPDNSAPDYSFLPEGWLSELPGQVLVAVCCWCLPEAGDADAAVDLSHYFGSQRACGSKVADGAAEVFTSFGLYDEGYSHYLVCNRSLNPYQLGRLVQRLLEIETYRILALMSLPMARSLTGQIVTCEQQLARVNRQLADNRAAVSPERQLATILAMASRLQTVTAKAHYRFDASHAYYRLVKSRLQQLKESELAGLQTLSEFIDRRLTPAIDTCTSVATRLGSLTARVAQSAHLVSAKVDLLMAEQSQRLLASMDKRGKVQLNLQVAVEGFSIAAMAYYAMGLVQYLLDGLVALGVQVSKPLLLAAFVPVILLGLVRGMRKLHQTING